MRRDVFLLVFCVLALVSPAGAEAPGPFLDLDFELPECSVFWAAQGFVNRPFEHALDDSQAQSGRQSMRVRHLSSYPFDPQAGGPFLLQIMDAAAVAGKRVQLGGYIRTEGMTVGYAGLFVVASGPSSTVFAQLPAGSAATGSSAWSRYEVEADLPADITSVSVGLEMAGNGTAWFDNLEIQVDGRPWKQEPATSLAGPPPGHANWLRQRVTPLDSVLAGSGFADLQPLKQAIGDARIVSLGEGTHGTREFFQMKHRLFEFLVEEMGFTHFALEAGMPEADRINNYVLYGIGDPAELVEGMRMWIWNTQEVLDLVLWMRQYNASGKGPVGFAGFDMQFSWIAANNLYPFLRQAEPAYAAEALRILNQLIRVELTRRPTPADLAAARSFYDRIVGKRAEYLALGYSAERVDWMIQNARILVQFCEVTSAGPSAAIVRDRFLAENTTWLLDHAPAGSKIVLWAHNTHVKRAGWKMGMHLAERYGDDMYVLGFAFREGTYNAQNLAGVSQLEVVTAPPSSVEGLLDAVDLPLFFVDLRSLGDHGPARWFQEERLMRSLSETMVRCGFIPSIPAAEYDGLIWIDRSNPSVLLPFD